MIRPFEFGDVDGVLRVQSASPELPQWTRRDYERVARGEMTGWVVEQDESIVGFIVARKMADEMEILNIAVSPLARRRCIGTELLRCTFDWGRENGIGKAFLEVRETNVAALAFYEHHKFLSIGRRQRYYVSPVEDAIILAAELR
jgi:ribosomal-protein-alanine acetyltransferase